MKSLSIVVVALISGCGGSHQMANGPCRIEAPPHLVATTLPSLDELRTLLRDAARGLQRPNAAAAPGLSRALAALRSTLDSQATETSCRALATARASLSSTDDGAITAAQRSAVTLVLDLTAVTLSRRGDAR